jgi:hypothetical protein
MEAYHLAIDPGILGVIVEGSSSMVGRPFMAATRSNAVFEQLQ